MTEPEVTANIVNKILTEGGGMVAILLGACLLLSFAVWSLVGRLFAVTETVNNLLRDFSVKLQSLVETLRDREH